MGGRLHRSPGLLPAAPAVLLVPALLVPATLLVPPELVPARLLPPLPLPAWPPVPPELVPPSSPFPPVKLCPPHAPASSTIRLEAATIRTKEKDRFMAGSFTWPQSGGTRCRSALRCM